jgi:hypothetical protein
MMDVLLPVPRLVELDVGQIARVVVLEDVQDVVVVVLRDVQVDVLELALAVVALLALGDVLLGVAVSKL